MNEKLQKNFDIDKTYSLCEEIIKERKFESLLELNNQCHFFYNEFLLNREPCLSMKEECLFVLFYYIYYLLLDEKERNIFLSLQAIVISKNIDLFLTYRNFNFKFFEQDEDIDLEEKQCCKIALFILNKYTNQQEININLEKLNFTIIDLFIDKEWCAINNNYYLMYMLGIVDPSCKKIFSSLSKDILMRRFNEIVDIILEKTKNDNWECHPPEIESSEERIEQITDELRF